MQGSSFFGQRTADHAIVISGSIVSRTQCNDRIDNDGLVDYPNDRGCTSLQDDHETNADLSVTPSGPSFINRGELARYLVTIANNGSARFGMLEDAILVLTQTDPLCGRLGTLAQCTASTWPPERRGR